MGRFEAFLLNLLTVVANVSLTLLAAEVVLRFLPVATLLFSAAYAVDRRPFEHPTDGHWNAHGHAVAAAAVVDALADWPPLAGAKQR